MLAREQAAVILFPLGALSVKLSLFILYLRLFKPNRLTRWLIIIGMAACVIFYTVTIILNAALCVPSPQGPNDTQAWILQSESCGWPEQLISVAQGAFGTFSDIYLLVIPLQMVMRLHLPTRRKLAISAVFLTGIM